MKSINSLIFLLWSAFCFAQMETVKCDSFRLIANNELAFTFSKNKMGLYDINEATYLIKPQKVFLIFDQVNRLIIQEYKNKRVVGTYLNGAYTQLYSTDNAHSLTIQIPLENDLKLENKIVIDSILFAINGVNVDQKILEIDADYRTFYANLSVEKLSSTLGIFNYSGYKEFSYEVDYLPPFEYGISNSGIFNLKNNQWIIPPKYARCTVVDSFVFCLNYIEDFEFARLGDVYNGPPEIRESYDIYHLNGDQVELIIGDIQSINDLALAKLLDLQEVEIQKDGLHFIGYKAGKKGLYFLELFQEDNTLKFGHNPVFKEVLPQHYDFILYNSDFDLVASLEGDKIELFKEIIRGDQINLRSVATGNKSVYWSINPSYKSAIFADGHFIDSKDSCFNMIKAPTSKIRKIDLYNLNISSKIGLEKINESQLLVTNYRSDSIDPYGIPLSSAVDFGQDSIIFDPETGDYYVVYPPPTPGFEKSGVYDLDQNSWLIYPNFVQLTFLKDAFYTLNYNNNGDYITKQRKYDSNGRLLIDDFVDNISAQNSKSLMDEIYGSDKIQVVDFPSKSLYESDTNLLHPNQFTHSNYFDGKYYLLKDQANKWAVYKPLNNSGILDVTAKTKPVSLIHFQAAYDYFIWMEKDSIFIEIADTLIGLKGNPSQFDLKLQYPESGNLGLQFELIISQGNNVDTILSYYFNEELGYDNATYSYDGVEFIINENFIYDNYTHYDGALFEIPFFEEDIELTDFKRFQTETSCIWRKTGGYWEKATPYYASIEKFDFGYLAKTGNYKELVSLFEFEENVSFGKAIILDSNLKAKNYFDYYDFERVVLYEKGLSICLNQGCFFMKNNGEIITNPDWDDFEITEDGKLKAVVYNTDYLGEEYWFEPDEMYLNVEYFDLD